MIKQTLSFPKDLYKKKSVILKCTLNFKHFCKSHVLVTALNVKYVLKKHSLIPHTSLRDQIKQEVQILFFYTLHNFNYSWVPLMLILADIHNSQYLMRGKNKQEFFFKSSIFPCIKGKMDLLSIHKYINWT